MQTQLQRRSLVSLVILICLVAVFVVVLLNRQAIFDWWRLRAYTAPTEISALADATTMNDDARRLFYVHHPRIENSASFNEHCRTGEHTIVLGCYVENNGIYIFQVDDPRLDGIEEVTAAHEMLHAAYDRLSDEKRGEIDVLIHQAFNALDNERIKLTIEQYRQQDPSIVSNELHSILGSEVRTLPPELESYYKQYFSDRQKIVQLSEQYEAAFSERKNQTQAYERELTALKEQIDALRRTIDQDGASLRQQYEQLESMRDTADPASFNAQAAQYNRRVNAYNTQVSQATALIERYNGVYKQYEAVVLEQQDLYQAINSKPEAIPAQ